MILDAIVELMDEAMARHIADHIKAVGGQCVGEQFDMMTKHGKSFVSLNGSLIEDDASKGLLMRPFQMAYEQFPDDSHTGENICVWFKKANSKLGICIQKDVGTPTIDGASNGKKALKLAGKQIRICVDHQVARGIAFPTGPQKGACREFGGTRSI